MNFVLDRITFVLEKIEQNECLCLLSSDELKTEFYLSTISSRLDNLEYELLFINTLRKIVETYIKNIVSTSYVCERIFKFTEFFNDDELWHKTFNYFREIEDKFLLYGMAKFLAATFYTFPEHLFSSRLTYLLKDLCQNTDKDSCPYDLELLTSLIDFDSGKCVGNNISTCINTVSCTIPSSEDKSTLLCLELSRAWNKLLDIFLRTENRNICVFLNMWKHLCERRLKSDFLLIFLNTQFAVEFLSLSLKMSSDSFKLYTDIISQVFSSNSKGSDWKHPEIKMSEESVNNALSAEFFHSLSSKNETSSFCGSVCRNPNSLAKGNIKLDVTSKKVVFIILNLLAAFRNTFLLCGALEKVFDFLANYISNWEPQNTYLWIIDTFIEEDDLLFGVMLASVHIYCHLKDSTIRSEMNNTTVAAFMKEIDPHKTFIKFCQQLGNDHNELLSFLLSDETCCLMYLLLYLKLLLTEWKPFIEAHRILKGSEIMPSSSSAENSSKQDDITATNKLVSYSSSSNSDEECQGTVGSNVMEDLEEFAFGTVSVLINLKISIQKLVDVNEFPYNISPLINLLRMCEIKFHSVK